MARRVQREQHHIIDQMQEEDLNGGEQNYDDISDDEDLYDIEGEQVNDQQTKGAKGAKEAKGKNDGGVEDLINYKGIYYNDDTGQKYTDPDNGAHFEFKDMCKRIQNVQKKRDATEKQQYPSQQQYELQALADPAKALQKEKEEFLKSLGITQQKQAPQQPQPIAQQSYNPQLQKPVSQGMFPLQPHSFVQQQPLPNNSELQFSANNNDKQQIAQLLGQQQQQYQVLMQQQMQIQNQSKWRSKSSEKQNFLNTTQKMGRQIKPQAIIDANQYQIQKLLSMQQQQNELVMRGKTPENYNNKGKYQDFTRQQQTIQQLKASLGYNESQISTSSNQYQADLNRTQEAGIQNIRRSSQKSTRDQAQPYGQNNVRVVGSGSGSQQSRNVRQPIGNTTFYKRQQKTQQQDQEYGKNAGSRGSGMPEIESSSKFNNSLAIQNIGGYLNSTGNKSRNVQGVFKTAGSIGSAKGNGKGNLLNTQGFFDGSSVKGQSLMQQHSNVLSGSMEQNSLAASHGKKISGSSKFNQTIGGGVNQQANANLYSMIYQSKQTNLVSNYLRGIDSQVKVGASQQKRAMGSSRNQTLVAPAGTKKMTRNTMGGTIDDANISKSIGNRYY